MIAIIYLSSSVNFSNKFNFNFIVINVSLTPNSLHCVSNNIVSVMQCNTLMSIIFIIPRFIMLKYEVFGTFMTGVFKTIDSTGGSLLHTSPCTFISIKFHSSIISYFIISSFHHFIISSFHSSIISYLLSLISYFIISFIFFIIIFIIFFIISFIISLIFFINSFYFITFISFLLSSFCYFLLYVCFKTTIDNSLITIVDNYNLKPLILML